MNAYNEQIFGFDNVEKIESIFNKIRKLYAVPKDRARMNRAEITNYFYSDLAIENYSNFYTKFLTTDQKDGENKKLYDSMVNNESLISIDDPSDIMSDTNPSIIETSKKVFKNFETYFKDKNYKQQTITNLYSPISIYPFCLYSVYFQRISKSKDGIKKVSVDQLVNQKINILIEWPQEYSKIWQMQYDNFLDKYVFPYFWLLNSIKTLEFIDIPLNLYLINKYFKYCDLLQVLHFAESANKPKYIKDGQINISLDKINPKAYIDNFYFGIIRKFSMPAFQKSILSQFNSLFRQIEFGDELESTKKLVNLRDYLSQLLELSFCNNSHLVLQRESDKSYFDMLQDFNNPELSNKDFNEIFFYHEVLRDKRERQKRKHS